MKIFFEVLKYYIKTYFLVLLYEFIIIAFFICFIVFISTDDIMKLLFLIGIFCHIIVIIYFLIDTYKNYN